ncbi:MAG: ATP-dependent helicase HrpB [Spirochaetia bacterium]
MIDLAATGLPIVPFLPRISELLETDRALALTAEPGAGKSTLVPPFLMDQPWLRGGVILMLEPRRLAAVAVAGRIAELLGEPVGLRAGYRVRTATRVGRETRVEVVTEALLTRRIQEDPLLRGVGLVIFDEYHERSIHADLALALALEVRRARRDLALLAMSATLDTTAVADILGGAQGRAAPSLHCPGTTYPVRTEYRPIAQQGRWEEAFADGVSRLFDESEGSILAFLPGAGEIRRVGGRLSAALGPRAEVLPLHGTLRLDEQQRVIRPPKPGSSRRVILATSIAETSLTVPGISTVADSGLARLSRFHPATGLDRLVTEKLSESSAEQRRGRAGRLGPGVCVRFWAEAERLRDHADPEILRSDLSGLVLECALWGARTPDALQWIDPPPRAGWSQAREILVMLGLIDGNGPTPLARTVAALGLSPRLGVLAAEGASRGQQTLAAACAALLEERDGSEISRDPDFRLRLELIRSGRGGTDSWRRAVETEMGRILRRLPAAESAAYGWTGEQEGRVGSLLATAFPDRLARREPDGSYRLVTGRIARFPSSGSPASGRVTVASRAAGPWVVVLDADPGDTVGAIRSAAPVEREEAEKTLAVAAEETVEIRWEGLVPKGALVRRAGRLVLAERSTPVAPGNVGSSFLALLRQRGLALLPWNAQSSRLLARMRFYARARENLGGHSWWHLGIRDFSEAELIAQAHDWLTPHLKLGGGHVISAGGLSAAMKGLAASLGGRIDSDVPEFVTLPTGNTRAIDYEGSEPSVEARIQEVFGMAKSPRICGVPLTFRLLSPARRPLQITRDLESFWRVTYAEVRKEMRGRYPKHYWPENPLTAQPTTRVRPEPHT